MVQHVLAGNIDRARSKTCRIDNPSLSMCNFIFVNPIVFWRGARGPCQCNLTYIYIFMNIDLAVQHAMQT